MARVRELTERRRAGEELERVADEQAALRRVATLVARGGSEAEIFTAIAQEMARLVGAQEMRMFRLEADDAALIVAGSGSSDSFPVGTRVPRDGLPVTRSVFRTGEPARVDDFRRPSGTHSVVGTPILVQGQLWGAMIASTPGDAPLPRDTESRLGEFTELIATAIANAEVRAEVQRLADEQAALRRVATLVAEGSSPAVMFDAVAAETERLLETDGVTISCYEPGSEVTVVAHRGADAWKVPPGSRWNHEGENVTSTVRRTQRPARMESYRGTSGDIARLVADLGVQAAVGAPIVVDGGLWGVVIANWRGDEPPRDTEERLAHFAELLATAIANADSRDQLTASRSRLLTEADQARRRLARDLHDGAQQRLVHTIISLKLAQQALRDGDLAEGSLLDEALQHAEQAHGELRELAHGILPDALARGGLRAGLGALVERSTFRSSSTARPSGSRRSSRRVPISSWPRRSRTS